MMPNKTLLIAESSWDLEAFNQFFNEKTDHYLHNDFFNSSNKKNTSLFNRFLVILKIFSLCLSNKKSKIYFSSINFECYFPALIISWIKSETFFFVPNFFNFKDTSSVKIKLFHKLFKGKIYFTDPISFNISKKGELLKNHFSFRKPEQNFEDLIYIVVMPAAHSHDKTEKNAKNFYQEHQKIYEYLNQKNYDVHYLFHPRDKEYINDYSNVINHHEIKELEENRVCYVSVWSSLCLNRRYGGKYGFWCKSSKDSEIQQLPPSLVHEIQPINKIIY